jgi:biopolymer transport protein ExbD
MLTLFLAFAMYQLRIGERSSKATTPKETFWLKPEEGLVVIYRKDHKTIYDRTEIEVENLPEAIKEKVKHGYGIPNYKMLIEFLENYSS